MPFGSFFRQHVRQPSAKSLKPARLDNLSPRRRLRLEPLETRQMLAVLVNSGTPDDMIFDLPAGVGEVFLEDDGTSGNQRSQLRSADGSFTTTPFDHPANSLTINAGAGHAVTIILQESLGAADLTINTPDAIRINNVVTTGAVALHASGAISEFGPDVLADVIAGSMSLVAGTGIGTDSVIEIAVSALEAETDTGGIFLANRGQETVTVGGVSANLGGLLVHSSGDVELMSTGSIVLADTNNDQIVRSGIASGNVRLSTVNGHITVNVDNKAITAPMGNVHVDAAQGLQLGTGGSAFQNDIRARGRIYLNSDWNVVIDGATTVHSEGYPNETHYAVWVFARSSVSIAGLAKVGAAQSGEVHVGTQYLENRVSLSAVGNALYSEAGDIVLSTHHLSILPHSAISTGGDVVVRAGFVELGSVATSDSVMWISDNTLDRIYAAALHIDASKITITDTISPENIPAMSLVSFEGIVGTVPSAGIRVDNLNLRGGYVDLGASLTNDVRTLSGQLFNPQYHSRGFHFRDNGGDLVIGDVLRNNGIQCAVQEINIVAAGGNLIVDGPVTANNNSIRLRVLQSGAAFVNNSVVHLPYGFSDRHITIEADDFRLNSGSEISTRNPGNPNSVSGQIELRTHSPDLLVDLGSALSGPNFTAEELRSVGTYSLSIFSSGGVNISNTISLLDGGARNLLLHAGAGGITENTTHELPDLEILGFLNLISNNGIGASDDIDISVNGLSLSNTVDAVNVTNFSSNMGIADLINDGTTTRIMTDGRLSITGPVTTTGDTWFESSALIGPSESQIGEITVWQRPVTVTSGNLVFRSRSLELGAPLHVNGAVNIEFGHAGGGVARFVGAIHATAVGIQGADEDDTVIIHGRIADGTVIDGGGGHDTVQFLDTGTESREYVIAESYLSHGPSATYTLRHFEVIRLDAGNGADVINVSPSKTARFIINGNGPGRGSPPGDVLNVIVDGVMQPRLTVSDGENGFSGSYSFSDYKSIDFSGIETLVPSQFDLVAQISSPAAAVVAPGDVLTYSLAYRNDGVRAAEGVVVSVGLPAGMVFDESRNQSGWTEIFPGARVYQIVVGQMSPYQVFLASFPVVAGRTAAPGQSNTELVTTIVENGQNGPDRDPSNFIATHSIKIVDPGIYAVAADAGGGPHVRVYGPDGAERFNFFAYSANFTGGVRVAMGDVNRDGTPDIITAAGPGGGPHVRVFDGLSGQQLGGAIGDFFAYNMGFTGGVNIASADFNGDGYADIVTGADRGGGPHVRIISGRDGSLFLDFFEDPRFDGGVRVATGDINGDGTPDLITAPGAGTFPAEVHVFDGRTAQPIAGNAASITAYPGFGGGVYVASGDVDGDGRDDIITGAGAGGGPHVKVFSGVDGAEIASFFAYNIGFRGGVRVGVSDIHNDGQLEILTGAGPGGGPHVRAFTVGGGEVASLFPFNLGFAGGVFVAGSFGAPAVPMDAASAVSHGNSVDDGPGVITPYADLPSFTSRVVLGDESLAVPLAHAANRADLLFSDAADGEWMLPAASYLDRSFEDSAADVDTFWEELAEVAQVA